MKRIIVYRKGFIRILEVIIASLILLASLSFFFAATTTKTGNELEQMRVEDVLASVQKSGLLESFVKTNDITGLNAKLKALMPQPIDFSIEISGIPNPEIRIGCNCTDAKKTELENILSPLAFSYKQRSIKIVIQKIKLEEIAGATFDILFFFDKESMFHTNPDKQEKLITNLTRFLENGTVFLFSDLQEADVIDLNTKYGPLNGFMGLKWDAAGANFHIGDFYDTGDPKFISYRIADYFAAISGESKNTNFIFVTPPVPLKNKIEVDARTIIKSVGGNGISYVKINREILENGKGRSAWFAKYDRALPQSGKTDSLLKSAVLWASGERYRMDAPFKTIPAVASSNRYSYFGVVEGFEPFEISLLVWKIFF
ncbi:MAG: hypothetical protein HYT72_05660 [Candidatus Aenigmarchaeota archaeon]|nr:hypothetical protein [Candidatus Aenigmarchaeota archaeon]